MVEASERKSTHSWLAYAPMVALLVWVAVVVAAYYVVHKPWSPGLERAGEVWSLLGNGIAGAALLRTGLDLAFGVWLAAIACGIGVLLLDVLLGGRRSSEAERMVFGTGLGLGLIAFLFLLLGATAALSPIPAYFWMGVLSGAALLGLRRVAWRELLARTEAKESAPPLILVIQLLVLVLALLALSRALTPPVAWDSLVYHLTAPRRYIDAGGIVSGIDVPHFYFPALVEQLFTAALLLRDDNAAQLVHLLLAGLGMIAVYLFLRGRLGSTLAWLGVALLAVAGSLVSLSTRAYVEWGLLSFGFLAWWAMLRSLEQGSLRWLMVSGVLAGLALGVKYTSVFVVLALGWWLVWRTVHRFKTGAAFPAWRQVAVWAGVVALLDVPWLLRDLLLTGNPVYPFLFGGWRWDAWKAEWFSRPGTGLITEPIRVLAAPWELSVLGAEGSSYYDATLGPLFLALLPLLLLARPRVPWAGGALLVAAVCYGGWLFGAAQSELLIQGRLLLPALPFLTVALVAAWSGADRVAAPGLRLQRLLLMVTMLVLGLSTATATLAWAADPPLPYLVGAESRGGYVGRHLAGHYGALTRMNSLLPADARVLMLWEPRSYYCDLYCQPDALLYNWRFLLHQHPTTQDVWAALRDEGYTHLLLNARGARFFAQGPRPELRPEDITVLRSLASCCLEPVFGSSLEMALAGQLSATDDGYILFGIKPGP